MPDERENRRSYGVGIICALRIELDAMSAMIDEDYRDIEVDYDSEGDTNRYVFGRIGKHNVVLARLSSGIYGIAEATTTATHIARSFPNAIVLMVGIAGGVWSKKNDVRLGDVVVGQPNGSNSGVLAYRRGKIEKDGALTNLDYSLRPPRSVLQTLGLLEKNARDGRSTLATYVSSMFTERPHMRKDFSRPDAATDRLFQWIYEHLKGNETCDECDPSCVKERRRRDDPNATQVFYGTIGSADVVMKNAHERDMIAAPQNILAVEMEGAGVASDCQALIIRGVCDYADSHKNDDWHGYAAVAAAAYAKELLYTLKEKASLKEPRVRGPTPKSTPVESRRESLAGYVPQDPLRSHAKAVWSKGSEFKALWKSKTSQNLGGEKQDTSTESDTKVASDHNNSDTVERGRLTNKLELLSQNLSGPGLVKDRGVPNAPIEGTCEWIIKNEICQKWLNEHMGMLWVVAEADQGISNMSHFLYQRVQNAVRPSTQVVYYLCSGGKQNRNNVVSMLRTVLSQIVTTVKESGQIPRMRCVSRAFEQQDRIARATCHDLFHSRDALWKVLLATASDPVFGPIYAVLDALDDLDEDSIHWLIQQYENLVESNAGIELKVVVVSQEDETMRRLATRQFCAVVNLADNKEHVMSDLEKTASDKLRAIDCVPQIEGLRRTLLDKAEDSFVYVECVTKELAQSKSLDQIEHRLERMPSGLDPYLRYVLRQIFERGRLAAVTQILRLVAIAVRPLKVTEIAAALRAILGSHGHEPESKGQASREELQKAIDDLNDYIDQCSPLLQIRDDSVVFASDSAKAFLFNKYDPPLDKFHIDAVESNYRTALFCVEYIKTSPLQSRTTSSMKDEAFKHWPGLKYAMLHWCDHAKRSGPAAKGLIESTAFLLDDRSELRHNWWQTYRLYEAENKLYDGLSLSEKRAPRELDKTTPPPLHMCARLGLDAWVDTVLERLDEKKKRIAVNAGDAHDVPPLMWAAIQGNFETAKSLIAAGADVNALSTLLPKSTGSSYGIVRTINSITREASSGDSLWTANLTILYRAVFRAHEQMVELLLHSGADVNALGFMDFSTCHAAATTGNEKIMQMILDKSDKNVNMKLTATLRTPLHFAVESDSVEVTRCLLAHKADVKMLSHPPGYNALHLAIRGNANTLLIDELLASAKGYERQRVLEAMCLGDMAIHMAAEFASISTIQKLHDHKADLEARTLTWRDTAMIIAARKARSAAVQTLLENGATVNAANATGATALIEAAAGGFPKTVEILLEHGADVTATKYIEKSTPLHLASRNAGVVACDCFIRVIKLLLSKGADVNAKNAKIQTPLDKAANRKDADTMKLLREHGGVLYKPNKDVLERYKAYFDPAPEEELATSLVDLSDSDSRRSSLTMSRTETQASQVGAEILARLDKISTEDEVGDGPENVSPSKSTE